MTGEVNSIEPKPLPPIGFLFLNTNIMAKEKGTKHNKYTNDIKYNNTVVVRIDAFQALQIEELCNRYSTTKTAVVRLAINNLFKLIEDEETDNG